MLLQKSPTVKFDPSKKEHRQAVRDFMKRRAWADTKLRFSHDPEYGSVADQVQAKLLAWYMSQEEGRKGSRKNSGMTTTQQIDR